MKKTLVFLLALALVGVAFAADPVIKFSGALKTGAALQITTPVSPGTAVSAIALYDNDSASDTRFEVNTEVTNGDFYMKGTMRGQWAAITLSSLASVSTFTASVPTAYAQAKFLDKMITFAGGFGWGRPTTASKGWGDYSNKGLTLIVNPIPELTLQYGLPLNNEAMLDLTVALQRSELWAKYAMAGIVNVCGGAQLNLDTANTMGAYFGVDVLAVPNATIRLEGKFVNLGAATTQEMYFREVVGYNLKDIVAGLSFSANIDETMWNAVAKPNMAIAINPSVTYAFDIHSIGFGATYTMNSAGGTTSALSIDPSYTATFNGNAKIKTGLSYGIADLAVAANTLKVYTNFLYSF